MLEIQFLAWYSFPELANFFCLFVLGSKSPGTCDLNFIKVALI